MKKIILNNLKEVAEQEPLSDYTTAEVLYSILKRLPSKDNNCSLGWLLDVKDEEIEEVLLRVINDEQE